MLYKEIILRQIVPYLKAKNLKYKKYGKVIMIDCPFCENEKLSANVIPNTSIINCLPCKKQYTLLDIVRKVENKEDKEENILQYLKELLNIEVTTKNEEEELDKLLDFYVENRFDLVPLRRNGKEADIEDEWQLKHHKNKEEWISWHVSGLNIGLKTGLISNITVLDIDAMPSVLKKKWYAGTITKQEKEEALKIRDENLEKVFKILPKETLTQKTLGGVHLIYKYVPDLPKTFIKIEGIKIDIETDGGQIVIAPSKINDTIRELDFKSILPMPNSLIQLCLKEIKKRGGETNSKQKQADEEIKHAIENEDFKIDPKDFKLKDNNLDGCCNPSFVKFGGVLRKRLPIEQTKYVLHAFNKHILEDPMSYKDIESMCKELEKYSRTDESKIAEDIINYLKDVKTSTVSDLELAIEGNWTKGEAKKAFNKALAYLIQNKLIRKYGKNIILIEQLNWSNKITNISVPVNFKVPYFDDYARFYIGNMIIIGSQKKFGKTTLAMNFIKRFVNQGIKPDYVFNEKTNGFDRSAFTLGLKDGDFSNARCVNPNDLILRKNSVTVYDWVNPQQVEQGFAKTSLIFDNLVQKTEDTGSFLICFVQLRGKDSFFAPDQIGQFSSLLCRYTHESSNGTDTAFHLDFARDFKMHIKQTSIPCMYFPETKEVKRIDEL